MSPRQLWRAGAAGHSACGRFHAAHRGRATTVQRRAATGRSQRAPQEESLVDMAHAARRPPRPPGKITGVTNRLTRTQSPKAEGL
jgi:hypothetical protein